MVGWSCCWLVVELWVETPATSAGVGFWVKTCGKREEVHNNCLCRRWKDGLVKEVNCTWSQRCWGGGVWEHDRERRGETIMAKKTWGKGCFFFLFFLPIFFLIRPWNPLVFIEGGKGAFCFNGVKFFHEIHPKGSQPLAQSGHHELSKLLQKGWLGWPL